MRTLQELKALFALQYHAQVVDDQAGKGFVPATDDPGELTVMPVEQAATTVSVDGYRFIKPVSTPSATGPSVSERVTFELKTNFAEEVGDLDLVVTLTNSSATNNAVLAPLQKLLSVVTEAANGQAGSDILSVRHGWLAAHVEMMRDDQYAILSRARFRGTQATTGDGPTLMASTSQTFVIPVTDCLSFIGLPHRPWRPTRFKEDMLLHIDTPAGGIYASGAGTAADVTWSNVRLRARITARPPHHHEAAKALHSAQPLLNQLYALETRTFDVPLAPGVKTTFDTKFKGRCAGFFIAIPATGVVADLASSGLNTFVSPKLDAVIGIERNNVDQSDSQPLTAGDLVEAWGQVAHNPFHSTNHDETYPSYANIIWYPFGVDLGSTLSEGTTVNGVSVLSGDEDITLTPGAGFVANPHNVVVGALMVNQVLINADGSVKARAKAMDI